MAITYQWNDPHQRVLKRTDDSTTPDTITYVPAIKGVPEYGQYLVWEATAGQDVTPYRPDGYNTTLLNAKVTRVVALRQEVVEYCKSKSYDYWIFRSAVDSGFTFTNTGSGDAREKTDEIEAVFATAAALETAIGSSTDIDAIRNSTVNFVAGSHSI
jgi:hypothetical protein